MFAAYSWTQFFQFLMVSVIVYYLIVGLLFFRPEVLRLVRTRFRWASPDLSAPTGTPSPTILLQSLRAIQQISAQRSVPKEELILQLRRALQQHPDYSKESIAGFLREVFPFLDEHDQRRIFS